MERLGGGAVAGLIPAHAGKTPAARCPTTRIRAHPRSRGENGVVSFPAWRSAGSSPLTRGKLNALTQPSRERRLIPAHAGKTGTAKSAYLNRLAHPRSRGENRCHTQGKPVFGGSSPLTRGKLFKVVVDKPSMRLIPAHAGKTCRCELTHMASPAHPRSRGENDLRGQRDVPAHGSSPLTRGKRNHGVTRETKTRLIPAHAGKTG